MVPSSLTQIWLFAPHSVCVCVCVGGWVRVCVCVGACARSIVSDSLQPIYCSQPGSSVHGIFQARILKWVAISFSRGSSRSRDRFCISHVSFIGRQILYHCITWKPPSQTIVLPKGYSS